MSSRSVALEVSAPDFIAAVDLEARLKTIAPARVAPGENATVVVKVPQPRLTQLLRSVADWLEDYGVNELDVRINQRPFTVRRDTSGSLKWRDVHGGELDDIELEKIDVNDGARDA